MHIFNNNEIGLLLSIAHYKHFDLYEALPKLLFMLTELSWTIPVGARLNGRKRFLYHREALRNDLYYVEWGVKLYSLTQAPWICF